MPLSVVFEQLLVPRGPCLAEPAGAAGRAQAVPLCLTRGAPATALSPKAPGSSCVVLDQGTQETHLKWFQAKVNVYSAMLPGGRSCRAEAHEPIRAAVLQQGRVLGALGTAGPGGAGINQATAAERAGEDIGSTKLPQCQCISSPPVLKDYLLCALQGSTRTSSFRAINQQPWLKSYKFDHAQPRVLK